MFVNSVLLPEVKIFRATNVAECAAQAAAFVAASTNPLAVIIDVALTQGGGGNVDLELIWGNVSDLEADLPYPRLSLATFVAIEGVYGVSVETLVNAAIAARPTLIAYAWGTATGSAAGKVAAVVAFVSPGS